MCDAQTYYGLLQVLQAEMPLNFEVNRISINKNSSALLLVGLEDLRVMYLYGRSSMEENTIICRYVNVIREVSTSLLNKFLCVHDESVQIK